MMELGAVCTEQPHCWLGTGNCNEGFETSDIEILDFTSLAPYIVTYAGCRVSNVSGSSIQESDRKITCWLGRFILVPSAVYLHDFGIPRSTAVRKHSVDSERPVVMD